MCAVVARKRIEGAWFAGTIADLARLAVGAGSLGTAFIGCEAGFVNNFAGQERVRLLCSGVYHDNGCARTCDTSLVRDIRFNLVGTLN